MSNPYLGEIRLFGGNFAPLNWAFCDGQLLPISENEALFTLIGTTYGGDGVETFALPNLQSRVPLHQGTLVGGSTYTLGETGGVEDVTLTLNQIPLHTHALLATDSPGSASGPADHLIATPPALRIFAEGTPSASLAPQAGLTASGGSQPHTNVQPFTCVSFIIALFGVYPSPA